MYKPKSLHRHIHVEEGQHIINDTKNLMQVLYANAYAGFAQLAKGCQTAGSHGAPFCDAKHNTATIHRNEATELSTEELSVIKEKRFLHEVALKRPVETRDGHIMSTRRH